MISVRIPEKTRKTLQFNLIIENMFRLFSCVVSKYVLVFFINIQNSFKGNLTMRTENFYTVFLYKSNYVGNFGKKLPILASI